MTAAAGIFTVDLIANKSNGIARQTYRQPVVAPTYDRR